MDFMIYRIFWYYIHVYRIFTDHDIYCASKWWGYLWLVDVFCRYTYSILNVVCKAIDNWSCYSLFNDPSYLQDNVMDSSRWIWLMYLETIPTAICNPICLPFLNLQSHLLWNATNSIPLHSRIPLCSFWMRMLLQLGRPERGLFWLWLNIEKTLAT